MVKCSKITDDAQKRVLERNPRFNQAKCSSGIKQVRVGERYDMQQIHFEELKSLIYSLSCGDDDCAMDIEFFPRCRFSRMVYDCQAESCQGKKILNFTVLSIRSCTNDVELQETFCLKPLFSDC
ncbi:hypothetical protein MKW98_014112 [Papaver atlanticum]|uniref:Uncharacterized protein n=1 Tax=Papaver atlanticum TaxID=357466 RepID=A0AAD4SLM9_9MAGN|nr:hypothetical protein MKW98_014112 [Papaver atlanticum]